MKLIERDGAVKVELTNLVRKQGVEVSYGLSAPELNAILQEKWVKAKEGTFRAQLGGRFPTEEEMVLLRQLGASAIPIDFRKKYNGTLLLGATLKVVTFRMKFMLDAELDAQKRFRQQSVPQPVYFLGSTRQLDPDQEMLKHVPDILKETGAKFNSYWRSLMVADYPRTEIEMMELMPMLMDSTVIPSLVCAGDVPKTGGPGYRPANTAETVKEWLKVGPSGHYLIVSSQPFCENQRMAVERAVREAGKEGYTFDVCGPYAPPLPLSRWLDTLAKQLWEEVQLLQTK